MESHQYQSDTHLRQQPEDPDRYAQTSNLPRHDAADAQDFPGAVVPVPAASHYYPQSTASPPAYLQPQEVPAISPSTYKQKAQQLNRLRKLDKKWQRRLYWIVPLAIVGLILAILWEKYKDDFERWAQPLVNWLDEREAWSWVIPVAILTILSFPPLFGHEIVQLVVGLAFPIGVAIGIAVAGAVLGEAACFVVFKYFFTWWVDKKVATKIRWAAISRVSQQAGFRGVLVIRYSIVPPHLANPLFACTGMKFWLYMVTVLISLPKQIIFVILGSPSNQSSQGAKWAKVIAIGVLVIITIAASYWMRKKLAAATAEIEAERGVSRDDEDRVDEELTPVPPTANRYDGTDTAYHSAVPATPYHYQETVGAPYQPIRSDV